MPQFNYSRPTTSAEDKTTAINVLKNHRIIPGRSQAVVFANDTLAWAAKDALEENGITFPEVPREYMGGRALMLTTAIVRYAQKQLGVETPINEEPQNNGHAKKTGNKRRPHSYATAKDERESASREWQL